MASKDSILNMDDDFLREVEKTVIIPKMMRETAKVTCRDAVQAFEDCARGRSVTVVWYCREVKDKMYECFRNNLKDTDFEREKLVFLEKRQEHRRRIQLQEEEQAASQAAV